MAIVRLRGLFKARGRGGVAYHYVHRGGPRFWRTGDSPEGSPAYHAAYQRAVAEMRAAPGGRGSTAELVARYLASPEFAGLRDRTQRDYGRWAERFREHFGRLPARDWTDPLARRDLLEWRDRWAHSPKQADYAVSVALVILNWARERGTIHTHHCGGIRRLYHADRAEVVWEPAHEEAFARVAPAPARRALDVLLETGLSLGDACTLSRAHVEPTPRGRRIRMRRSKTRQPIAIPVAPRLGRVLDETPPGRLLILVTERNRPFTAQRLSQYLAYWMERAGLPDELRPSDTRGTAATRLLRAGLTLSQIATHMGWSVRYASQIIEHYATVAPDASDEILAQLHAPKREG